MSYKERVAEKVSRPKGRERRLREREHRLSTAGREDAEPGKQECAWQGGGVVRGRQLGHSERGQKQEGG